MVNLELYLSNIYMYRELENNEVIKTTYSEMLSNRSIKKKEIKDVNDRIIMELKALDNTVLSEEERSNLKKYGAKLFDLSEQLDMMIAYDIFTILFHDALLRNNFEDIVEYNYFCGLAYYYLTRNCSAFIPNQFFENNVQYIKRLDELTVVGKKHVISSYGNRVMPYINKDYSKVISLGKEILEYYNELQSDGYINMDIYKLGLYRNIATCLVGFETGLSNEEFEFVYNCVMKSIEMQDIAGKSAASRLTNYEYSFILAKYYNNELSIDDLIYQLKQLCIPNASLSDAENYLRVFDMNGKYLFFINKSNLEDNDKKRITNEVVKYVLSYAKSINKSEYQYYIDDKILNFIVPIADFLDYHEFRDIVYKISIARHLPTYVHSKMVQEISNVLAEAATEKMLDKFNGLDAKTVRDLIDEAASFHDIGKWICMDIISNSSRSLESLEFQIIKEHPSFGYNLIKDTNFPQAVKDAILYHQTSFDGKSGYPNCPSDYPNKMIVSIITIADCIDAGTDFIGRPYAKRKTLNDLKLELLEGKNTRYSCFVELLNDNDVFNKIEEITTKKRVEMINSYKKQA